MALNLLTADTKTLQQMLTSGTITSAGLIDAYLAQIQKHDDYLHAMIQITPLNMLEAAAKTLDEERAAGKVRGPLHGIPIIVKDNIATHPSTGLRTTAGSFSLWSSKPESNAKLVDLVRGSMMPSGWSAIGGQAQSAYVRGGLNPQDSKDGHSNPSGSSSGSVVGVSAGYAPVSIGTETDGSLLCPAGRAALYTIKPTIGLVPQHGIVPMSHNFDSAGPMTKTSCDLAVLLDVLASRGPSESYTKSLNGSWSDISVGILNYSKWRYPDSIIKPVDGAEAQILKETRKAYDLIKTKANKFVNNIDLITVDAFEFEGKDSTDVVTMADMKKDLTAYLQDLEESEMRTITDIIDFNDKHAEKELPPHHPRQDTFIKCQNGNTSTQDYNRMFAHVREVARDLGVERVFQTHGVNVIIGPADGFISTMAAAGGKCA
ncbi:amidase signature domain-containing protein [Thelonectria olida]|uniref:Amidase signature domain-containing protein n=1 Tax=Thelonectria olida TaxID=1576542 RepID=A0A9P8VNY4_9HYPO|nr:amidase signature domain-containing protein [Thelonectria olida]